MNLHHLLPLILFIIAIGNSLAIEIDPKEEPLVQLTFPLDDKKPDDSGPHTDIIYTLYQNGIGYSALEQRDDTGQGLGSSGTTRHRLTFWLTNPELQALTEQVRTFPLADTQTPPSQQIIIEGTALEGKKIISTWKDQASPTLTILALMEGVHPDLQSHFSTREDTPENRAREAVRYLSLAPPTEDIIQTIITGLVKRLPESQHPIVTKALKESLDKTAYNEAIFQSTIKTFTTGELKALADFHSNPAGESAMKKKAAYTIEIKSTLAPIIKEAIQKAQDAPTAPQPH